jgi:hypothetical protein
MKEGVSCVDADGEKKMIAKIINYLTSKMTWKDWCLLAGAILLVAALVTGLLWLLLGSAAAFGPKVLQKVNDINNKQQDQEDELERKRREYLERLRKEKEEAEEKEREEERRREEKNKKLPEKKTAEELEDIILDGIETSGRD